jgi:hypothetical protein
MRGMIVVAARELVAQRAFIAASLLIAVLVLVAPWAPGMSRWVAEDVRAVAVLVMGLGFTLIAG